jgi:hypothetical protein
VAALAVAGLAVAAGGLRGGGAGLARRCGAGRRWSGRGEEVRGGARRGGAGRRWLGRGGAGREGAGPTQDEEVRGDAGLARELWRRCRPTRGCHVRRRPRSDSRAPCPSSSWLRSSTWARWEKVGLGGGGGGWESQTPVGVGAGAGRGGQDLGRVRPY